MWSAWINSIGKDKLLHFAVSACLAFLLALILPSYRAIEITILIGIAKEVYDKASGRGNAEWQDIVADIIGAVIGGL